MSKVIAELIVLTKIETVKANEKMYDNFLLSLMDVMLNPWMETETSFKITTEDGVNWACQHYVAAYDGLSGYLYGYGDNPRQAFERCENLFNNLKVRYDEIMSKRRTRKYKFEGGEIVETPDGEGLVLDISKTGEILVLISDEKLYYSPEKLSLVKK